MKRLSFLFSIVFVFACFSGYAQSGTKSFYLKGIIRGLPIGKIYVKAESPTGKVLIDSFAFTGNEIVTHQIKNLKATGFVYLTSFPEIFPGSIHTFFISAITDTINFEVTKDQKVITKDFANSALSDFNNCLGKYYQGNPLDKKRMKVLEKEVNPIYKKLNSNNSTKVLADYIFIKKEMELRKFMINYGTGKIKEWMELIGKDPELLNTDITVELFFAFQRSIGFDYYDNVSANKESEKIVQDSFVKLYSNLNVPNELKLKFGNLYSSYLSSYQYYTALGNYITNYANFMVMPVYQNNTPRLDPGVNIGNIYGQNASGDTVQLNIFQTQYKLIIIWSPDCGHCLAAIPEMNELYKKFQTKNISFVSFSMLKFDSNFVNPFEWSNSFSILNGWRNEFIVKYGISYTPVLLLLNKKNEVVDLQTESSAMDQALIKLFH